MKRWKLILALIAVFISGAVLGGAVTLSSVQRKILERMDSKNWSPRTVEWLNDELHLSAEQRDSINPKIDKMVDELVRLQADADAERKSIFGNMLFEISDHLTAQQQADLKSLLVRYAKEKFNVSGITKGMK